VSFIRTDLQHAFDMSMLEDRDADDRKGIVVFERDNLNIKPGIVDNACFFEFYGASKQTRIGILPITRRDQAGHPACRSKDHKFLTFRFLYE
jgi:hypothetical protein